MRKQKVYTRNGLDCTKRFSVIVRALDIPGQAIIDGEVVVVHDRDENGTVVLDTTLSWSSRLQ